MQDQNNYQQNTPEPDYGFIQGYDQPAYGPKKKTKIFIAFGVLLVGLVGIGGLVVLSQSGSRGGGASQSKTEGTSENAYVSDPVISLLRDENKQGLYELLVSKDTREAMTPELFERVTYNPLVERSDFGQCTQLSDTSKTDALTKQQFSAVQVRCNGSGGYVEQRIVIAYEKEGETVRYRSIVISDYSEESP